MNAKTPPPDRRDDLVPASEIPEQSCQARRRPRGVTWMWLAALLIGAAAVTAIALGDAFSQERATNGPPGLWIGIMLMPLAALLAGAATLTCLFRRGFRAAGMAGVLGFVLVGAPLAGDLLEEHRLLAQVLAGCGVAAFALATVLAFRSARRHPSAGVSPRAD